MVVIIKTKNADLTFKYNKKVLLSDVIKDANLHFNMPCGGNGTCGKCKVDVSGELSQLTDFEKDKLTDIEICNGIRLACGTYAIGNAFINYTMFDDEMQVLEKGINIDYDNNPVLHTKKIKLDIPTLENPTNDQENVDCDFDLSLLKTLPYKLKKSNYYPEVLFNNDEIIDIINNGESYYGVAVDIGTTTVAIYLYSFPSGKCITTASGHNAQAIYGADVISRIETSISEGTDKLQNAIVSQINELIIHLCKKVGIIKENIYSIIITGNTTMLHMFCGIDTSGIAVSPFVPATLFGKWNKANELGISISHTGMIYLPRCITAYVGADITTAIIASGMTNSNEKSILIDIGTNGEMALWSNNSMECCSTAAGPAFEGAGLYMGMAGINGAIDKVYIQDDEVKYTTIGNSSPIGICGSGIIDAIAVMLNTGILDYTGVILEDGHNFEKYITENDDCLAFKIGASGVIITQKDIRQMQLAKSAIATGVYTLLNKCNLNEDEIDTLYISGGFGSFINKESAATIGLIPKSLLSRVITLGNAAGSGASALLCDKELIKKSAEIAKVANTIELSNSAYFMDKYIDCMFFE